MAELCHVCDLFRTALFGPTNSSEDHLDDGLGNDLPRPMADAPATLGVRARNRTGSASAGTSTSKRHSGSEAIAQPSAGNGATATPSVTSEGAAATSGGLPADGAPAPAEPKSSKPAPKTKFSKRAPRGLKSAPAYMSFDDVDVEDDDSDGELFVEEHRGSGSRSPGTVARAYSVNAPSVYREPKLPATEQRKSEIVGDNAPQKAAQSAAATPAAPHDTAPPAPAYKSQEGFSKDSSLGNGVSGYSNGADAHMKSAGGMGSQQDIGADASLEVFPSGTAAGGKGLSLGGSGIGADRMSIPRDGSTLDSARPHGQSESFHGYKGYPGYEPDTPVAESLTYQDRNESSDALTIVAGAHASDPRSKHPGAAVPTPSSTLQDSYAQTSLPSVDVGQPYEKYSSPQHDGGGIDYVEAQEHMSQPAISPTGTMDVGSAAGGSQLGGSQLGGSQLGGSQLGGSQLGYQNVQVTSSRPPQHTTTNSGTGLAYGSHTSSAYRDRASPAGSMASSFRRDESGRNIQHMPSEDGMGSVLGTLAGTEDSQNEDLQWRRSALRKFYKVMVRGEGLRVVKHNRSGGSQMRIIRYEPDIKALVWNSKRYMKKAGSANVPIVNIKRVGREGNTVSVTAAGRGTIGFEPQRIRDAKILAEALCALVDREERSAMWRG